MFYRPVDNGQGAQAEKVELDQTHGLDIVLVELGNHALPAFFTVQRAEIGKHGGRDHHAAGVLAGIARHALQRQRHIKNGPDVFFVVIGLAQVLGFIQRLGQGHAQVEGNHLGDAVDETVGLAHDAADIAHHRLRRHGAVGNDLRDAVAAVFLRHIVDHPVAPFHAEVDIEVRQGDTLGVEETFEQQVELQRIEIGDLQGIGHQRASAGTTSGADGNAVVLGPLDKVGNDKEVAGKAHIVDYVQLDLQAIFVLLALLGIVRVALIEQHLQALFQALVGNPAEITFLGLALGNRKLRQIAFAQLDFQIAAAGDFNAVGQRLGNIGKQLGHFLAAAQILLLAVVFRPARVVEGAPVMDADAGLVGLEFLGFEKTHVIGGHHRQIVLDGQLHRLGDIGLLVLATGALQLDIETVVEAPGPLLQTADGQLALPGQQGAADIAIAPAGQGNQAFGGPTTVLQNPLGLDNRHATVLAFEIAAGNQPRQVQIAGPVLRQQHHGIRRLLLVTVAHQGIDADNGLDAGAQRGAGELDHGEQVTLVGQRHRRHAILGHRRHQRLDPHQPVNQRVFGMYSQVDKTGFDGH